MEITNPTDWPGSMPELRTIDNLLRCSICYDFLDTAMILPDCSHNFCSLCIRRYLPLENKCPTCKKPATISDLKNNRILDELVKNFVAVRSHILTLCLENDASPNPIRTQSIYNRLPNQQTTPNTRRSRRNQADLQETSQDSSSNDEVPSTKGSPSKQSIITKHFRSKVKNPDTQTSDDDDFTPTTPFRSPGTNKPSTSTVKDLKQSERVASTDEDEECMIVDDGDDEGAASSSSADSRPDLNAGPNKDKASCPVCGLYVNSKHINAHLDACLLRGGEKRESKRRATPKKVKSIPKRKTLPKLVYNLMSDKEIRKKLKEFKLSHQGTRKVMVKRLQEYTLLYNAECDSATPKSVEAIIKEVEKMEKLKMQPLTRREESVTRLKIEKGQSEEEMEKHQKDYLSAHKNQFDKLINDARQRMKKVPKPKKKPSTNQEDQASTSTSSKPQEDNTKDSVTIAEVHIENVSKTCSPIKQPVIVIQDLATETAQSNKLSTRKTRQKNKRTPNGPNIVVNTDLDKVLEQTTDKTDQPGSGKHSAKVSLSFASNDSKLMTEQKVYDDRNKRRSMSDLVSAAVNSAEESAEEMDQGTNSSMDDAVDDIDEPDSPSLLCSQAVLGDAINYNVTINQQDNSMNGAKSGLLDTLMSDEDTSTSKPSGDCETSAVLAPPSPSETSKAGDELPIDQNNLEESDLPGEGPQDIVNCIPESPESPQPSTSGFRPRKRKKVEPAPNSESGSSVGDDFGLRRSRRAKKTKT